ncbi:unnamed protein product [Pieris macdunnoughi]|uniref:FP protein C-terminal domain-containing protein n=1 Tax=Pieris macdunnoughi TaxID=345717 RepID=A0A821TX00_9NEOP|nr:unnamed protein product [Pieris macdunnoughi]
MTQNQEIQKSVENLTSRHDELLQKISDLEEDKDKLKQRVSSLESKLDLLEKSSCCTKIEMRNLPKQENQTKKILIGSILSLGSTIGLDMPVSESEIKNIFRSKNEAIIVDFTTTSRKEDIITKYKNYNRLQRANKQPLLNTDIFNLPGAPKTIYVSELFTSKAKRLSFVAQEYVRGKKLVATWTSYGKVYVKKEEGSAAFRIEEESDLHNLFL